MSGTQFYKLGINTVQDFGKLSPNYLIAIDDSISYQGSWYGPPDPQPGTETKNFVSLIGCTTIDEVVEWIKINTSREHSRPPVFKVFEINEMSVKTEINVSVK